MHDSSFVKDGSRIISPLKPENAQQNRDLDFFTGVSQGRISMGPYNTPTPVFYYDCSSLLVAFVTPLKRIRALLPSAVMHPLRLTPWHGVTYFSAFEYRDTDIGPYNEFGIFFPITLHKPAPVLTGVLRAMSEGPMTYIWQLPVTTEIARFLGVEHAGFRKFIADIKFDHHDGWVDCSLAERDSHILSLSVKTPPLKEAGRMEFHMANIRNGRILHGVSYNHLGRVGLSRNPADVHLELGEHSIAQELKRLGLGRMIECRYYPEVQMILYGVVESFNLS
jgi:hypothetical protein